MPHVFPDITKTLLSTEEAEGRPTSSRPMTAQKWGSDLNTLPKKDVGFGHDELELFSA